MHYAGDVRVKVSENTPTLWYLLGEKRPIDILGWGINIPKTSPIIGRNALSAKYNII